ncbi:cytochrome P450 [Ovoidimarina sediminis]|uniref:cytochrome P450 n=1 Tax=Ovoidimarina sediminis TaxID=3079856 RepID=UPI00290C1C08|nr:cytochrome P450 [Rhodophyticola sp. MJ-SS7]MDU8943360.1 cytochrome P450 [Rhodophyticola sp. MJ-SS7]
MVVTIASLAVLAAVPWPVYSLLALRQVRDWRPAEARKAALGLLGYAAGVAGAWALLPQSLPYLAGAGALWLLGERIRAHNRWGAWSGLPPGSLSLAPHGPWTDEAYFRKGRERYGPVFKFTRYFKPCICVIGHERAAEILGKKRDALGLPPLAMSHRIPKGYIRFMAPEDREALRVILREGLDCALNEARMARLRAEIDRRMEAAVGAGAFEPRGFCHDLTTDLMLDVIYGVMPGDPAAPAFRAAIATLRRGEAERAGEPEIEAALVRLGALARERADRGDGVLQAAVGADPGRAEDETLLRNLAYITLLGSTDVGDFIVWALKILSEAPEWLADLRAAPDARLADMCGATVKEILRLEQSEFVIRRATEDLTIDGFRVPKGWMIVISTRENHRDPEVYDAPHAFRPARFLGGGRPVVGYRPLGAFDRTCLGAPIVDLVGTQVVRALARGIDLKVTGGDPRRYAAQHWRPNPAFRVAFACRPKVA